jgi:hypothetical protein
VGRGFKNENVPQPTRLKQKVITKTVNKNRLIFIDLSRSMKNGDTSSYSL